MTTYQPFTNINDNSNNKNIDDENTNRVLNHSLSKSNNGRMQVVSK